MRRLPLPAILAIGLSLPISAAEVVYFEDGRGFAVRDVRLEAETARLVLEDGAEIVVPADRISGITTIVDGAGEGSSPQPVASYEAAAILEAEASLGRGEAWREAAGPYAELIARAADRCGVSRSLLAAVAQVESGFDPTAVSRKGAVGLLQLMPTTARRFGALDPLEPEQNIEAGARYLRWLIDRFGGRLDLALAGYNAGEGAVERYAAIPPYRETLHYVVDVLHWTTRSSPSAP